MPLGHVRSALSQATANAEHSAAAATRAHAEASAQWLAAAASGGAGLAHRIVAGKASVAEVGEPLCALSRLRGKWEPRWCRDGHRRAEHRRQFAELRARALAEDPGRMLTAEDVVDAARAFPSTTPRGATGWSPADVRLLGIPAAAELAGLLNEIWLAGSYPPAPWGL